MSKKYQKPRKEKEKEPRAGDTQASPRQPRSHNVTEPGKSQPLPPPAPWQDQGEDQPDRQFAVGDMLEQVMYQMIHDDKMYRTMPRDRRIMILKRFADHVYGEGIEEGEKGQEVQVCRVRAMEDKATQTINEGEDGHRHAEVPKPVIPGPGELPGEGRAPPGTKGGTPVGASVQDHGLECEEDQGPRDQDEVKMGPAAKRRQRRKILEQAKAELEKTSTTQA